MGIEPPGQVVVDEPVRIRLLAAGFSKRVLPCRERAVEACGDAHDRNGNRRKVSWDHLWPSPSQEAAHGNEDEVGEMSEDHDIGEQPTEHRI